MPRLIIDDHPETKRIIKSMLKADGRDFNTCEFCGKVGRATIHHTRYEGCTYHDLRLICQQCNLQAENVGLT